MRHSNKSRPKSVRSNQRPRPAERVVTAEGVYANNFFMHAATSHVGTVVKLETTQGVTYEGIFKTFSQEFDVVLELAHKVDNNDPQKFDAHEVVDNLIFQAKDIVYMSIENIDVNYAVKDSFIDSGISKFNGEVSGEKKLEPWEGALGNGEECDLESTSESNQNGWDVNDMFERNEELGVGSTYDDSLADYTVQIIKNNTKDFKEEEAKAARIAMEIERNPSSQARASLENGENEEELYASVVRPSGEIDGKYVPPAKRKNSQHHRSGGSSSAGSSRGSYSSNDTIRSAGNQRSYNVPESPSRTQMNNSSAISRYHHQAPQQYHQQPPAHGAHSQPMRESSNRSSPENKNAAMCASAVVTQPQNIPPYPAGGLHQQRAFPQNVVPVTNHSQNVPPMQQQQQQKSQRTSPISVQAIPNGNADYQAKQMPPVSQQPPHQYHNQGQQVPGGANVANTQRKHHHHQHHSNSRGREDQISELKKFGADFTLSSSYDGKNKEAPEAPKQIQVVNNRNKSPPTMQQQPPPPVSERNVVTVSLVPTLPQSKHTTTAPQTPQHGMVMPSTATQTAGVVASHAQAIAVPQPGTGPALPPTQPAPTTQVGMKPPPPHAQHVVAGAHYAGQHPAAGAPPPPNHQHVHMQPREAQVLIPQHLQQSQMAAVSQPHPASLPQQPILPHKQPKQSHQVPMHQSTAAAVVQMQQQPPVMPPQAPVPAPNVPIAQHQAQNQQKTVISSQTSNVQSVHAQNVLQPGQHQSPNSQGVASSQPNPNTQCVQRSPPQSQNIKSGATQTSMSPSPSISERGSPDAESNVKNSVKDDDEIDDVTSTLKKSTLNPNAKEFVYNPAPKSFTPVSRSPSTPTQSRPHTPQTPSYNVHSVNTATGIQMVVPGTYVVAAAQPTAYVPAAPPQSSRLRKVTVGTHRTEYHPSNMQVAAATGQPLLAPSVTLTQSPLAPGTQFAVQGYSPHPHLAAAAAAAAAAQPYQHVQMVRMVPQQGGGVVPLVPSSISYHDTTGSAATTMYMNHSSGAVAMAPHTQHVHHPQQHPPPSSAPSPSQTPQGPSQSHTPNSYQQPPMATQSAPPFPPVMCPIIPAPPPHGPPHHMVAAPAQQHAMQQYLQHPQSYQRR
ncbi:ataxin-2 homolog isoform X2 [Planococcus citri]|uniref:ataxin-2 homolog isoform X2 n=1 Tax=Planococcus citri TaxID=170843 RepID=UPI0031F98F42